MEKLFLLMATLIVAHSALGVWPFKKAQPAASKPVLENNTQQLKGLQQEINKLINDRERLKKEVVRLSKNNNLDSPEMKDLLRDIDQGPESQEVANTLKNINELENEKDERIADLEKQVEHLGTSYFNTLKTFEANINSKDLSNSLNKLLTTLDTKESVKLINEAIANALYRFKFMYTEARYLLDWTNGKINWEAANKKGIKPPVLKDNFSENQIKNMVMDVRVD